METTLDVPIQLRELVAISIDNIEKAFAFFFDAATKSIAPNSPESIALLKRVIAVKMGYARKRRHYNSHIADHKSKSRLILFA